MLPRCARDCGLTAEKRIQASKDQRVNSPHSLLFIPHATHRKANALVGVVPIDSCSEGIKFAEPCAGCSTRRGAPPTSEIVLVMEVARAAAKPTRKPGKTTVVRAIPTWRV